MDQNAVDVAVVGIETSMRSGSHYLVMAFVIVVIAAVAAVTAITFIAPNHRVGDKKS